MAMFLETDMTLKLESLVTTLPAAVSETVSLNLRVPLLKAYTMPGVEAWT